MAKYLVSRGHTVRVLHNASEKYGITKPYDFEGVEVWPNGKEKDVHFHWAQIVFTHLDWTKWTVEMCRRFHKPCFFIAHNSDKYYEFINDDKFKELHVIYNTNALKQMMQYNKPSIVLHPAIDISKVEPDHKPINNRFITLVSLNKNKGGEIFYKIAEALPNKMFLGIKGSYDTQIVQDAINVVIAENTPEILPLYKQTRILLMPSEYESYGLTCTEAMYNGIPVICTKTWGLEENAGTAGIYIKDREDVGAWVEEIEKLDQKKAYIEASKRVKERALELDPTQEFAELERFIYT